MQPPSPCARSSAVSAFIGLGSNLGSRRAHILFALRALGSLRGTRLARYSSLYATTPVGPKQPEFLNAVAEIRTSLTPAGLLVELKRLEALRGRRPGLRWGPRPLDCDLLLYGSRSVRTRILTLPHPLAFKRAFVTVPLAEIAPKAVRRRCLNAPTENVRLVAALRPRKTA